jgi:hypothetical protein
MLLGHNVLYFLHIAEADLLILVKDVVSMLMKDTGL